MVYNEWFLNQTICQNLHGPIFESFFVTAQQYRYDWMCGLQTYDKTEDISTDARIFGGGIPLPAYSKTNPFVSLCVSFTFIETSINALANHFAYLSCAN